MKKRYRKTFCWFMVIMLAACMMPVNSALAAQDDEVSTTALSEETVAAQDDGIEASEEAPVDADAPEVTVNKVSGVKARTASRTSVKVSWSRMKDASGYQVYRATSKSGHYSRVKTVTTGSTTSFMNKKLITGKTYYYKIRAYQTVSGDKIYGPFSAVVNGKPNTAKKANLVNTMSSKNNIKLNKFFDPFSYFSLSYIKNDRRVIGFCVFSSSWGIAGTGYSVPERNVEAKAKRYFGVEKINHAAVGDHGDETIPSYRNGFYGSGVAMGYDYYSWYNVSKLTDNGDGTYTAKISMYDCDFTSPPSNRYDRIDKWKMKSGTKIVSGRPGADNNVYRTSTDTVVLKKYTTSSGTKTWQIVSINGYKIPKTLL